MDIKPKNENENYCNKEFKEFWACTTCVKPCKAKGFGQLYYCRYRQINREVLTKGVNTSDEMEPV